MHIKKNGNQINFEDSVANTEIWIKYISSLKDLLFQNMSKYENDINELFNDEPFTRELLDSIGFSCSATEFYQNLLTLKYGTQDVWYEYNFKLALEEYKIKEENKDREVNLIKTNATENLVSSNFSHYPREETKYVEDNDNSSSSSVSFIKKITSSPVTKSHNYEDISTVKIGFLKVFML